MRDGFFGGFFTVRAQDNPAQAAARAALMGKMTELDAQQIQPTNPAPLSSVVIAPSAGKEQAGQPANTTATPPPPVIVVTASGARPPKVSQQQRPRSDQQPPLN